jgi:hypothetical protein
LIVATILVAISGSLSIIFTWVQVSPVEGLWNPFLPARRWNANIQYDMVYLAGCEYQSNLPVIRKQCTD